MEQPLALKVEISKVLKVDLVAPPKENQGMGGEEGPEARGLGANSCSDRNHDLA